MGCTLYYWKFTVPLLDGCFTNKNGDISLYKEVLWLTTSLWSVLKAILLLIIELKKFTKVNSECVILFCYRFCADLAASSMVPALSLEESLLRLISVISSKSKGILFVENTYQKHRSAAVKVEQGIV